MKNKNRLKLSIGIIFKNEIRCLERCLKSLQPLRDAVPCELVMADTGSTDGSREIAEKYADILFDFPWVNDFSAARNAVMDRCSGVWYFSIDADEWMDEDVTELVQFLKAPKLPHDFAGVNVRNYRTAELGRDQNYMDFIALRMARLSTGIRYDGIIHETWHDPSGDIIQMMCLDHTWLYHDGYVYATKEAELAKNERNMALLRRKYDEDPKNFQTLLECIDSSKHNDKKASAEYARLMIAGLNEKWANWKRFSPVIMHSAVSVAKLSNLPELEEWIALATELCSDSIFYRVDISYYAFFHYWEEKNYEKAAEWGDIYCKGMDAFHANQFNRSELIHGVLDYAAPFWARRVYILLPQAYLECGETEKAFSMFSKIQGEEIDDIWQVELCTRMLLRLHRTTQLDMPALVGAFWEQINQPFPDKTAAEQRRKMFLNTASTAFSQKYIDEETGRSDFLRHGYTVFLPLEDACPLGRAAVMLETDNVQRLEEMLAEVTEWSELPAEALFHALEKGITFPLPEHPLFLEEMDSLASQLAQNQSSFIPMVLQTASGDFAENRQRLTWTRGLVLGSVRAFNWAASETDIAQGLAVARAFARVEKAFLQCCYAPESLSAEGLFMLPSSHRFGWYCTQAFEALDAGDKAGYARLLREGLAVDKSKKLMVEFLIDHTPELQMPTPSAELLALADQVRAILANFASDDPAVATLKQSEVYQKVAYLIEGTPVAAWGGLAQ